MIIDFDPAGVTGSSSSLHPDNKETDEINNSTGNKILSLDILPPVIIMNI
jgi:hypothetical protein